MNAFLLIIGVLVPIFVEAKPPGQGTGTNSGCVNVNRCEYKGICYEPRQYWTDSSAGCTQFQCIATTNEWDSSTTYSVGQLGCPLVQPPQNGAPYIRVEGDPRGVYPACCPTIVLLKPDQTSSSTPASYETGKSGSN